MNGDFDRRIYFPTNADFGVYQTRRYPKGGAASSNPGDIEGRAPAPIWLRFANPQIAPHGLTERWRYTVPQNRKAIILAALSEVARVTAGVGNAQQTGIIYIQRFGSTTPTEFIRVTSHNDTIGSVERDHFNGGNADSLMFPGDAIVSQSAIGSGDGAFVITAHLLEFNATESVNRDFAGLGGLGAGALSSAFRSPLGGAPIPQTIRSEGTPNPLLWAPIGGGWYVRR